MTASYATISDGLSVRRIVAFDVLRWNLRLGLAIAPRELSQPQRRRRRRPRLSGVPPHLREDIGLPPEEDFPLQLQALQRLFIR